MVAVRMRHQDMTRMIASQIFVFRWRRRIFSQERIDQQTRAPGDTISKTACPSQGEIVFFSLGDGVCASAARQIAKALKKQTPVRIPMLR